MTRRKVIFYNDLNNSYIVSEEYNGDKVEMARFGLGICEHSWEEFMEAMDSVQNLADFLKVISQISNSYHAAINGVLQEVRELPGARISIAHNTKELFDLVGNMDEVWEVRRGIPGARILDVETIAPKPSKSGMVKRFGTRMILTTLPQKPGDYVTQDVVDNAMDCLPPACMTAGCSQMGEPYSTEFDERSGEYRNTYATFRKVGGEWPHRDLGILWTLFSWRNHKSQES